MDTPGRINFAGQPKGGDDMPGPQFFQTNIGQKYYSHQLPELTRQISRLATAMEANADVSMKLLAEMINRSAVYRNQDGAVINRDEEVPSVKPQ